MTLFRLDASIRVDGSASREIADIVEAGVARGPPRRRGRAPAHRRRPAALRRVGRTRSAAGVHAGGRAHRRAAARRSRWPPTLADELLAADADPARRAAVQLRRLPAHQDLDRPGHHRPARGRRRPAAAGGQAGRAGHGPRRRLRRRAPRARAGTTRPATCARILADVWGADLTVVEREFTLVGVNPALDEFTDLAAELHAGALGAAARPGAPSPPEPPLRCLPSRGGYCVARAGPAPHATARRP